jgi:NAD(P)-dependent dehydrogenase (short-subunit alcohol dehydrogenase family)
MRREALMGDVNAGTLQGRVVVVTGGLGILGAALVTALRAAGARPVVIDFSQPDSAGNDTADLVIGGIDLAEDGAAERAFTQIADRYGTVDALVNVAGGFRWQTIGDGDLDTWDLLYRMNVRTTVATSRAALAHIKDQGGRIVNVGAIGALKAATGMGAYAASKAGVMRFTEALAEELKDRGITVNAVLPSIIDTPQNRKDMPDADASRWVTPQALADVIVFLLGPQAQAITGALLPVSGRV